MCDAAGRLVDSGQFSALSVESAVPTNELVELVSTQADVADTVVSQESSRLISGGFGHRES